jgi:diguanylate cyclase (GGDEF)-like protein/PAS domain S-box-containing protein
MGRSASHVRSLKAKITFVTLGVFVLSLWALSYYASRMLREDMQKLLGEQQFATVSLIATQINRELTGRLDALERTAHLAAKAMRQGPATLQSLLEQQPALQVLFNGGMYITDREGTAIADYPLPVTRVGVDYSDREYIATPLREKRAVIGQAVIGKRSGAPVFVMAVPIRDADGRVLGVLAGVTRLSAASFLDEVAASHYGKTGGYLVVDARRRQIVTATDKNRIMESLPESQARPALDRFIAGTEGSLVVVSSRDVEVLASARAIPAAGWLLAAGLPTAEAFLPIAMMQQRMLWATVVLTLLAGLSMWWLVRRQLAPIVSTADTLAVLSKAEATPSPLPLAGDDEIRRLIDSFNRLLETLARREQALRDSEERFKALHDASSAGILIHEQGVILDCNEGLAQMTGYRVDELIGTNGLRLIAPEWHDLVVRNVRSGFTRVYDVVGVRKDGSRYPLSIRGCAIPYKGRTVRATEYNDITERKRTEERLQLAASVFSHAREAILITTPDGTIIEVNDAFTRITGYARDEALGHNPRLLDSRSQDKEFFASMWRDLTIKGHWHGELWNRRKNGELFAAMQTISAVRDARGEVQQYVALFSDISAQKAQQRQLEHIAHYDALTTLPNRVLLADRLHQAMAQAPRRGDHLAVAYLDLDGFKQVNDRHGHETGDLMLVAKANDMQQTLRDSDTLARLGGDEFVAVLPDLPDVALSLPMLDRLLEAVARPVTIGDHVLQVSASVGVAFYPQHDEIDADQLLRQADQAMYQAKQAGKNRYHVFDAIEDRNVRGHHETVAHIRRALEDRQLVLHYQPKVNLRNGQVIGLEALIRWQHPQRGLLPPAVFLPVIEDHPLAVEVGEWVIDAALTQMAVWRAADVDLPVSVNVGARQLQRPGFAQRLRELIAAHPALRPSDLELEILETSALEDLNHVARVIEDCAALGVGFSLDDFGTGYSSLTYLKRLSVNQIKIDRSFVHDMLDDPDDLAILSGILGLASAFGRQAVAEGVESVEHGTMLLRLGCECAQGYGIARPMPAGDVTAWLAAWRPDAAWSGLRALGRDELPLLFAGVEHRAWVCALEEHLVDGNCAAPPLDVDACSFSAWLAGDGRARYAGHDALRRADDLHRRVHALAQALCDARRSGRHGDALAGLPELHTLRDALLAQLNDLLAARCGEAAVPAGETVCRDDVSI